MIMVLSYFNASLAVLIIFLGVLSLRLLPYGRRLEPVVANVFVAVVFLVLINGKHLSPSLQSTSSVAWYWFDTVVLLNIALHQWAYTLRRRVK